MTYIRDGWEYLDRYETAVYGAIRRLAREHRTGNNSQIASYARLGRTAVGRITTELDIRGFIENTGKGAAYHWRVTNLPVPYSVADRQAARELRRIQRALNEQIRAEQENR